jgi:hypothetical protein
MQKRFSCREWLTEFPTTVRTVSGSMGVFSVPLRTGYKTPSDVLNPVPSHIFQFAGRIRRTPQSDNKLPNKQKKKWQVNFGKITEKREGAKTQSM